MCVCVCACAHVCVFGHHFFVNTYSIKQYKYHLFPHFCIYPFEFQHRFYGILQIVLGNTLIMGGLLTNSPWIP